MRDWVAMMVFFKYGNEDWSIRMGIFASASRETAAASLSPVGRRVKTHRLVVKDGTSKCGQILYLEIGRGVRDQSEAGGM
jgi:hypothetical protein